MMAGIPFLGRSSPLEVQEEGLEYDLGCEALGGFSQSVLGLSSWGEVGGVS